MKINNKNYTQNINLKKADVDLQKSLSNDLTCDTVNFSANAKLTANEQKFISLRDSISTELKTLCLNSESAAWDFYIDSNDDNFDKMNKAQDDLSNFWDNKEVYEKLKEIKDAGGVNEPHLKKQFRMLSSSFGDGIEYKTELKAMENKENEIAQKLNSYVMKIDGKPISKAEINKILQTETDVELRKKAFDAKIKSGDLIADDLVELVKMRNDFAKKKGYDNYFDYQLAENYDITSEELDKLLSDVEKNTRNSNKKIMNNLKKELCESFNVKQENLKNYHFGYLSKDNPEKLVNDQIKSKEEVVEIAKKAYKNMGYDVENLPIILDLFPRENKNTHGFCFPIEVGKDARILANLTNDVDSLDTILHELGHSVYTVKTDNKLPYLQQDTTATMTEAVAMMMGDLVRTESLLKDKISPEVSKKFETSATKEDSLFIGSSMNIIDFERNMYKNPDQNLKQLWKDMSIKYKGRSKDDDLTNEWATVPHYLSHPAYYQNYFRASLIKAQLYDALTKKLGNLTQNNKTAEYLNENLFKYGGSKFDNELLLEITGSELSGKSFCDKINNLVNDKI